MEPTPPPVQIQPGQQPTKEQIEAIQRHMRSDAERMGISMDQYIAKLKEMAARQMQAQMQQQQQGGHVHGPNCNHGHGDGHQHGQTHLPVGDGPPKPEGLAMANFLRSQPLKTRTCVFNENKRDMFRVKRAIRALQSPAYQKAQSKNPLLPKITDRQSAETAFKLLPMSMLALRVQKMEPDSDEEDAAPAPGAKKQKKKRIKGQWKVQVVPQQDTEDDMYYVWLYDGPAWRQQLTAVGALILVLALVLFPLWPLKLRQGAWYLSMAFFVFIALFFAMAIFRLILFIITMFTHAPGLWLFPNLFEDVGFVDSFIPLWAWQTVCLYQCSRHD
jgi:translocation protein SEC62